MLDEALKKRNLPDVMKDLETGCPISAIGWKTHRLALLETLAKGEYGIPPPSPEAIRTETLERRENAFGGKAVHEILSLTCPTPGGPFTFPFHVILPCKCVERTTELIKFGRIYSGLMVCPPRSTHSLPVNAGAIPVFLHLTFSREVPDPYFPVEDILDAGFGMASFCYEDVVPDQPEGLSEGLAALFGAEARKGNGCGAIGYWVWAARRHLQPMRSMGWKGCGRPMHIRFPERCCMRGTWDITCGLATIPLRRRIGETS